MSKVIITSHLGEIQKEFDNRKTAILEALGSDAEGNAVTEITDMKAVDTGRLRNSITHVVDDGESKVYIGTNVEYAPYVELGTYKMASRPFLRNAIMNYRLDYLRRIKQGLK